MRPRTHLLAPGSLSLLFAFVLCSHDYARAQTVTVDFDELSEGVQAGNVLASFGVTFTTGDAPDALTVGSVFSLAGPTPQFQILAQPANAVSPPNFAVPLSIGIHDVLMSFATPIAFVSLRTDHYVPEALDVVRLLALAPTGNPNEYEVLAMAEGFDDAVSAPADTLSVSTGSVPFHFALFQTTTEDEGFDDLVFGGPRQATSIPALSGPGAILLVGLLALLGVVMVLRN